MKIDYNRYQSITIKTLKCDHKPVVQYFTVALFVFQFYPACKFGKFVDFGLGTIGSERPSVNGVAMVASHGPIKKSNLDSHSLLLASNSDTGVRQSRVPAPVYRETKRSA